MTLKIITVAISCLLVTACAADQAAKKTDDFVQIDNPFMTMSKDAPAKVWVPRSSVEGAVPRGGEAVRLGVGELTGK